MAYFYIIITLLKGNWLDMEYITVGTDTILREYMSDIIDTERIVKPAGGIWCTDYDVLRPQNCDWINHLIDHPGDLMMKSIGKNPFSHKAAILKVNDGAKVFTLAGNDDYDKFLEFLEQLSFIAINYEGYNFDCDVEAEFCAMVSLWIEERFNNLKEKK
jgi:hypothetical protein